MSAEESNVRVAVRVRPVAGVELSSGCRECVHVCESAHTVSVGAERTFTFDHAFGPQCTQAHMYASCVRPLVTAACNGYNATVLAYGQTGSGKTYTMGTSWEAGDAQDGDHYELSDMHGDNDDDDEECLQAARRGVIPRAIRELFTNMRLMRVNEMNKGHEPPEFRVQVQFIELYNEELIDLLEPQGPLRGALKLTEDGSGGVHIAGAARRGVTSAAAALAALREGALARSTAATRMNATSSRSHAVFSLLLHQRKRMYRELHDDDAAEAEYETLSAKFHFVDLAGSERLKRTGATGDRAKEGISINCGLLALGNVISALGDKSRRAAHVPYRDSRLTRLLQDSLGGNSRTLMIACVSAVDADFAETLSTLKYANRAKNIRNRCVLNQDVSSRTVRALREELGRLRLELQEYRQGKRTANGWSDAARENAMLTAELEAARARLAAAHAAMDALTARHAALVAAAETAAPAHADDDADGRQCALTSLVSGYVHEIERLRAELLRRTAEQEYRQKRAAVVRTHHDADVIGDARRELDREKELLARSMGELELQRSLGGGGDGPHGVRERAEGESGGETDDDGEDDEEAERKCAAMSAQLAALSEDIDTKARLVEQLEDSERRMQELRRRYEAKLQEMQGRLKGGPPVQQRQGSQHLVRLKEELSRLRRERVQLVRRMREEALRHRQARMANSKEVAQLRKESRRNANIIRSLEADRNLKEQVLRRKQEEVSLLRRSQRKRVGRRGVACDEQWERLSRWLNTAVAARTLTAELQHTLQQAAMETRRGAKGKEHLQYLQRTIKDAQQQLQLLAERDDLKDLRTLLADADEGGARVAAERAMRAALNAATGAAQQGAQLRQAREELRHLQLRLLSDVDLANVSSGTCTRPVSPAPSADDSSPTTPTEPFQRNA